MKLDLKFESVSASGAGLFLVLFVPHQSDLRPHVTVLNLSLWELGMFFFICEGLGTARWLERSTADQEVAGWNPRTYVCWDESGLSNYHLLIFIRLLACSLTSHSYGVVPWRIVGNLFCPARSDDDLICGRCPHSCRDSLACYRGNVACYHGNVVPIYHPQCREGHVTCH